MFRTDQIDKFIELRAQGWSLGHIASELHIAKRTLVEWSREYAAQIQALRALEQELVQEKILASREEELTRLLFRLATDVREQIRKLRMEKDSEGQESSRDSASGQPRGTVPATNGTPHR